jgi:16S rRNA (cytidine1402-2'-O)-methyltransferase|tara:strand:- start:428 stop:1282 length:855 start_codon:yes stop_codon:yes gene_type:complete
MSANLFIVATPIGNLQDISQRAITTLQNVSLVAVEDTRHSKKLWSHYGIKTPMLILNKDNEKYAATKILGAMEQGGDVALISDAGTPIIHDPGNLLVAAILAAGYEVIPIPGSCALVAALSVSGMLADSFMFCGFLPAKSTLRKAEIKKVAELVKPLVFYESPHRIMATIEDMIEELGSDREAFIAREMTKVHEQYTKSTLGQILTLMQNGDYTIKGEIVLIVAGAALEKIVAGDDILKISVDKTLLVLMKNNSLKDSVAMAAEITNMSSNLLYNKALLLRKNQ